MISATGLTLIRILPISINLSRTILMGWSLDFFLFEAGAEEMKNFRVFFYVVVVDDDRQESLEQTVEIY